MKNIFSLGFALLILIACQEKPTEVILDDTLKDMLSVYSPELISLEDFEKFISLNSENDLGIDCSKAETQAEMNVCMAIEYQLADDYLTQLYERYSHQLKEGLEEYLSYDDKMMVTFKKEEIEALENAQVNFKKYRDNMRNMVTSSYDKGSMAGMMGSLYAYKVTVNQIQLLEELLDQK